MDFRQLRYFLAVAETGSFTEAAEVLNMAQPPLSRQIKKLELRIGTELFDRTTKPISLSLAGEALYAEAKGIVTQLSGLRHRVRHAADIEPASLRIGFVWAAGRNLFPWIVGKLQKMLPDLYLDWRNMTTAEQQRALLAGEIDVGLAWLPSEFDEIETVPVLKDRLCVALPARHDFATEDSISVEMLTDQTWLYACQTPAIDIKIRSTIENVQNVRQIPDLATAIDGVAAGLGFAIIPGLLRGIRSNLVACVDLHPPTSLTLAALNLKQTDSSAVDAFIECVQQVSELPTPRSRQ